MALHGHDDLGRNCDSLAYYEAENSEPFTWIGHGRIFTRFEGKFPRPEVLRTGRGNGEHLSRESGVNRSREWVSGSGNEVWCF